MIEHNKEINLFDEALHIDNELYNEQHDLGYLRIYTIRSGHELIGYCAFFLFFHTHHKTCLHAKQDVLYIKKENRGRCLPFLTFCDSELKELGVKVIHQCVPAQNDFSKMLKRLDYKELETIYIRRM